MHVQVWGAIDRDFQVVSWADHKSGSVGLTGFLLFLFRGIAGWHANGIRRVFGDVFARGFWLVLCQAHVDEYGDAPDHKEPCGLRKKIQATHHSLLEY
jgi:hypothetical protein